MGTDPQGNGAPEAPQGQAAPGATTGGISLDDVNRAITARLRDYEKKLDTKLGESFQGFEAKLGELLAARQTQEGGDKPNAPEKGPQSIEEHPQFRSLQKQLSELKNKHAEAERLRDEERARARDMKLRSKLADALAEHGVDGSRAKHAIAYLVDGEKRVSIDPDETIVFRDANGDALDLSMGLKTWIQGEDAKLYLPPRGAAGSGESARPQTGTARGNAPPDPIANLTRLLGQRYGMSG